MRFEIAAALLSLCMTTSTQAQLRTGDPDLVLIESTERNEDPLGLDEATGRGLEEAAKALPKAKGPPPPIAERGEALSAIAGVTERTHKVNVVLEQGLAFVEVTLAFENRTPHATQVAYRLSVPQDAVPLGLEVCPGDCTERAHGATGVSATLTPIRDSRGTAFALLASRASSKLTMHVRYIARAEVSGGRVEWSYPARGFDPRVAQADIHVKATGMTLVSETDATVDATREHVVQARVSAALYQTTTRATCGSERVERRFRATAPSEAPVRPLWLLLDASPSMEGPARSRAPTALAALLAVIPESTPLTVFAFGAKATRAGRFVAGSAELVKLSDLLYDDHGSATKLSKVLEPYADALRKEKPRIVVVSDGQLDTTRVERESLERARRNGAELWLVDLSGEPLSARIRDGFASGGGVLSVAELADRALSTSSLERLSDALSVLSARQLAPGLRAGSQRVDERRTPARTTRHPKSDDWLCALSKPAADPPAVIQTGQDVLPAAIAALPYQSVAAKAPPPDTGMPKESVLNLLRTQLVPRSRACLRSDRKGRGDYAVGLTFRMTLARREIADAQVLGDVPSALKSCLLDLLDHLQLPWFSGRLLVNYPIHTEREPDPPTIELAPDVADTLDRAMKATNSDEAALPSR